MILIENTRSHTFSWVVVYYNRVQTIKVTKNNIFRFKYHVGDSEREEQRTSSGEVSGNYAFVAPEGDEFEFKYAADLEGYRVESEALPVHPEDTDDVKAAREAFFAAYQEALERAEEEDSDEDDEESDESDEDYYGESSEESSEEDSSEEDDDEISNFIFKRSPKKSSSKSSKIATNHFGIPYPYRK